MQLKVINVLKYFWGKQADFFKLWFITIQGGAISPNVFAIKIFPKKFAYFGKFGDMKKIIFSFKNEKRVGFFEISVIWANSAILEQK